MFTLPCTSCVSCDMSFKTVADLSMLRAMGLLGV